MFFPLSAESSTKKMPESTLPRVKDVKSLTGPPKSERQEPKLGPLKPESTRSKVATSTPVSKPKRDRHSDFVVEVLSDSDESPREDEFDFFDLPNDPANVVTYIHHKYFFTPLFISLSDFVEFN